MGGGGWVVGGCFVSLEISRMVTVRAKARELTTLVNRAERECQDFDDYLRELVFYFLLYCCLC